MLVRCPTCRTLFRTQTGAARCDSCALTRSVAVPSAQARPFWRALVSAFAYPFRGAAALGATLVAVVCILLAFAPAPFGLAAIGLEVFYALAVVRASAAGRDELPDLEAFSSPWDLVRPFFALVLVSLVGAAPAIALVVARDTAPAAWMRFAALAWPALYVPAAIIVVAHSGGSILAPFALVRMVRLVTRSFGAYVLLLVALGAVTVVATVVSATAGGAHDGLFGLLVRSLVDFYAVVIGARMLGSYVHERRFALGLD